MISLKTSNWQIKNIDTILFDKDGTFIDLHYFWGKMTELRAKEVIKNFKLNENLFEKIIKGEEKRKSLQTTKCDQTS